MKETTPQNNTQEEEIEDLPFEVDESVRENGQNGQIPGVQDEEVEYIPPTPGEEWIEIALAAVRVREAIHEVAHELEKKEQDRTTKKKADFLDVYAKNMGTIGVACDKAEVARSQYYHWLKTDAQFRSAIAAIDEKRIDMVEDELFALIQKHDGPSIRFFLERKSPEYKAKSQTEVITGEKTFEELLYDQAQKRKALAEAGPEKK